MANKIESGNSANLTNRGRGRPKGAENKTTKAFRETVNALLEDNAENVSKWLKQVAEGMPADEDSGIKAIPPAPDKALGILSQLAEYATPKLARQEHVGEGGGDIGMTFKWVE